MSESAETIREAVTALNAVMGGLKTPWASTLRRAALAHAANLQRWETEKFWKRLGDLVWSAEYSSDIDRIIALIRGEGES